MLNLSFNHFYAHAIRTVGPRWMTNWDWDPGILRSSSIKSWGSPTPHPHSSLQSPQPRPAPQPSVAKAAGSLARFTAVALRRGGAPAGRPASLTAAVGGRPAGRQTASQAGGGGRAGCGGRERVSHCARVREGRSERASEQPAPVALPPLPPGLPSRRLPSAQRPGRAEPSRVGPGPCCSPCTVCGGTSPR